MKLLSEREFFEVLETAVVDKAFTFLTVKGALMCEHCLARTLAHTLVTVLFPIVREELKSPRRSYQEVVELVDGAIFSALWAALE
jgi:hypothetical protein